MDTIESAVSVYNILRYINDGLAEYLGNPDKLALKKLAVDFIKSRTGIQIVESLGELDHTLHDDFWDFFTFFGIHQKIEEVQFSQFLSTHHPSILPLLRQKTLLKHYIGPIREYFISDPANVRFYIEQNRADGFTDWRGEPTIPNGISKEAFIGLVSQYVEGTSPSFGYLDILAEMASVPPKIRLAAQKRADMERETALSTAYTFNVGIEISYQDQNEPFVESYDEGTLKLSYSLNWILENREHPTLLNNFIYLFRFIDNQGRITLCYQESESGVMERFMGTRRTDRYPENLAYFQKNQAALIGLHTYDQLLRKHGMSIEGSVAWFFKEYLFTEFGIAGFQADIPDISYSLLDRYCCKESSKGYVW